MTNDNALLTAIASGGTPILAHEVNPHQHLASLPVSQLVQLVLDPEVSENPKLAVADPRYERYAEVRKQVQRLTEGQKKKNAGNYAQYLTNGVLGDQDWVTPPIVLFKDKALKTVKADSGGSVLLIIPGGDYLIAIDGETQRIAWGRILSQLQRAIDDGTLPEEIRVPVVVHHGRSIEWARQAFHDLNVFGVRPNTALGISMDNRDLATAWTRRFIDQSELFRDRVEMRRRQLRRRDTEIVTIGALRSMIVTATLGAKGLQVGAKQMPDLPDDVNLAALQDRVLEVVAALTENLEEAFVDEDGNRRLDTLIAAPPFMAALGAMAHRAIDDDDDLDIDDLIDLLSDVQWERELPVNGGIAYPWLGVGGKLTSSGRFTVGSAKEVGYQLINALAAPDSDAGKQVRGVDLTGCTVKS